jgi:hypothetical protein
MIAETEVREVSSVPHLAVAPRVVPDETRPKRCVVCACPLPQRMGPGRPQRTCSPACRKAAQRRRDRGLPESTPVVRCRGRRTLAGLLADRMGPTVLPKTGGSAHG